ncbi:MAG: hypothetical protein QM779_08810 [Propionicimonas sp.]|uniref:hypothetical protein n=1 Tax=Propionicimonas sp. TaxID=1955623 RepID=UPI003D11BCB1
MSSEAEPTTSGPNPALADLFAYPFMSALTERRTRRIPRGFSVHSAGALDYQSPNEPAPLSPLEEAVLITSVTGVTGLTTHDGPLIKANGAPELATPFLNIAARTGSSADNAQATYFFLINDDGISVLKHPTGERALELLKELPPKWADWTEADWLASAAEVTTKISGRRLEFPREWPYYLGWNAQASNQPGTTIFLPMVDCTWQYINALLIIASEPDGKRSLIVDDWNTFHPRTPYEWLAKLTGEIGLTPKIPYQPVGGMKWLRQKFVNPDNVAPLGFGKALRTDYEPFFYLQNLMLLGQSMGLGGWIHGSVFPPYLYADDPAKGWHGLGFRMEPARQHRRWAPVPASQPNPVGIDGVLEGLCPPYVASMDEAVDRVVEEKYRNQAGFSYANSELWSRVYRNADDARTYTDRGSRFGPRQIQYVKDACNYIYETYGRFPAHVDAFYTPGMWLQFSHLELEYYDRYFDPAQYTRQAAHDALWHP